MHSYEKKNGFKLNAQSCSTNRCYEKFRNVHRRTSAIESFLSNLTTLKKDFIAAVSCEFCEIY